MTATASYRNSAVNNRSVAVNLEAASTFGFLSGSDLLKHREVFVGSLRRDVHVFGVDGAEVCHVLFDLLDALQARTRE